MIPGRCTMEQSNLKKVEEWMECFANQWHWCSTKEEIKLAILCEYYRQHASWYR
ncbi:hypothetical protein [Pasteuria penetrans]|uniref:hypothetical protein n=1 Tax=Pasteuria penetrans TaxID=86005 RepID=UPI000F9D78FD|nr:hypothetical protein [Pasteuria penetrans]